MSKRKPDPQKARRAKRKAAGLCVQCGKVPAHGKSLNGKAFLTCGDCREGINRRVQDHKDGQTNTQSDRGMPHPFTTTGKRYRVKRTGKAGVIVPCPGDNPIILQFGKKPNTRQVYHRREVEEVIMTDTPQVAIVPILEHLKEVKQNRMEI